ncbi:TetR/AcrR family transcriptional regulator [Wenjunlia tyrosinilytica]|uniref:TetR/AcrR family transcriptional regulator n=1 Tax=Wenjunlia tyrosinilytica TaxID=1544741 RepID=UPI001E3476E8|nr:TetR/AcrR family transcriptional regulator [Wenjunlia tyrosinilytica]
MTVRDTPTGWNSEPAGAEPRGRPRGRPRSEAVEQAILEGVLRLLEGGGTLSSLTVEGIAKAAGVGKATIYRRWPGKEALLLDALATLDNDPLPETGSGSVRDDLVRLIEFVRQRGVSKRESELLRLVTSEVMCHPDLSQQYHDRFIAPRREALRQVLVRGIDSGELRDDIDLELLGDLFAGPMLMRTVLHQWAALPEDLPERIVDAVLDGVRKK